MGPRHPDVAISYNILATLLRYQGDLRQAKEYHGCSLAILQQTLGPQHPDVAGSYNNLANVLVGQAEKAMQGYRELSNYFTSAMLDKSHNGTIPNIIFTLAFSVHLFSFPFLL